MTSHRTRRVRDAMLNGVKVLPATATVDEVERFFDDDHVHLAVLVEGKTVVTTLTRHDLASASVAAGLSAREIGTLSGRVVRPDDALDLVRDQMLVRRQRRVVVADVNLELRGLLCMKRLSQGFCTDEDVRDRAEAAAEAPGSWTGRV